MSTRKIKQQLDKRNRKWLRYVTPRVRNGVTHIENFRQFMTAFGEPCPQDPYQPMGAQAVRVQEHIEDTGEVHDLVLTRPKVFFKEVDHCTVIPNFDLTKRATSLANEMHTTELRMVPGTLRMDEHGAMHADVEITPVPVLDLIQISSVTLAKFEGNLKPFFDAYHKKENE